MADWYGQHKQILKNHGSKRRKGISIHMKLTKTNIKEIKRNGNSLEKYVCDYILDEWDNYDDKANIFEDVLRYGCQSGVVGSLIYYSDTVAFYKKHRDEINGILQETMSEYGCYDPPAIFGDRWDKEDPLAIDDFNQNLLAWFGFEETMRKIGYQFGID